MLLTLLVLTQVTADWVEISQQHYRKPIRTHSNLNPFTTPYKVEVEETTKPWAYSNKSVSEHNWNKSPTRSPNVGNVKRRVHVLGNPIKPTEAVDIAVDERQDFVGDEFDLKTNHGQVKPIVEFSDNAKQKGTVERVPNIGNIKRVHLNSSPVKSPALNINNEKLPKNRYEEFPLEDDESENFFQAKKTTETIFNNRRVYLNKLKNQYNSEATSTISTNEEIASFTEDARILNKHPISEFKNRTSTKNIFTPKPTFVTETDDFIQNEKQENRFHKVTQTKTLGVTEKKHIFTTVATDLERGTVTVKNDEIPKHLTKQNDFKNTGDKSSDSVKHRPVVKNVYQPNLNRDQDKDQRKHKKDSVGMPVQNSSAVNEKTFEQDEAKKSTTPKPNQPDNKIKNMESLLKLMKVVADTISQNSRRSFGGKIRYLNELKDSILANIAERIDATWPDDDATIPHRRSRSAQASPRGHHVQFPSSESALMTISFLTFAVFLIKLVLQVIQTYKNKAMMVAPVMVASAGRSASAHLGHH